MHTDPLPYQLAELMSQVSRRHIRIGSVAMPGDMLAPSYRATLTRAHASTGWLPGLSYNPTFLKAHGLKPNVLRASTRYPALSRFTKRVAALSLLSADAPPLVLKNEVPLSFFCFPAPSQRAALVSSPTAFTELFHRDKPSEQFAWSQRPKRFGFTLHLERDVNNGQQLVAVSDHRFGFGFHEADNKRFRLEMSLDPVLNAEQHKNAEGGKGLDLNSFIQFNLITMP